MPNTFIAEPEPTGAFAWTQPSATVGPALQCRPLLPLGRHLFTASHLLLRGEPAEWQALADALDTSSSAIRLVKQVHRTEVAVVRCQSASPWDPPAADILLSDDPDVVIAVRIADCAPVLIADSRRSAVAAVHAGWRGTVRGAAGVAIAAMQREFGSVPSDLVAAIGPCLGVCCGEVGGEVVEEFRQAGHGANDIDSWFSVGPGGRHHLHLARANRDQLLRAGLRPDRIHDAGLCTRSYPEVFHSYRAAGPNAGRMAALIRCG